MMQNAPNVPSKWQIPFFALWIGQAVSLLTSELVQFALPLWLLSTSGSARTVATAAMMALLPKAIIGPLAGAWVDRWNRRSIMILSDGSTALTLLWLAFLISKGLVTVWHVYLVVFVRAVTGCFQMPAMFASTAMMVPKRHLSRVAGLNQLLHGAVWVVAPLIGATLYGTLKFRGMVMLEIIGALLAVFTLCFIVIPKQTYRNKYREGSLSISARTVIDDVKEGVVYLRRWRGAVWMLLLSLSINFIARPVFSPLLAIFNQRVLGGFEGNYAVMMASLGLGFVTGGIFLGIWGGFQRKMQTSLTGVLWMGLSILALGITNNILTGELSLFIVTAALFIGGCMSPITMGPIQALVQSSVEPAMQGRVITLMESASTIVAPFSIWMAGMIFDRFKPQTWYLWGGITAVVIGLAGFATPVILNLGVPQPVNAEESK